MVEKMNPEIKAKWLEALRSGRYKQGSSRLRHQAYDGDRFCCLGVLCDILDVPSKANSLGVYIYGSTHTSSLPMSVQKRAGISGHGQLPDCRTLTGINDSGVSFRDIADVIEREL